MSCLEGRIPDSLCNLLQDPENAARRLYEKLGGKKTVSMGTSGFGSVGYPKSFPQELGSLLAGENGRLIVLTGASAYDMDERLVDQGVVARRYPYQNNPKLRKLINDGVVAFQDYHLGEWPYMVKTGHLHRFIDGIDVAVVEASLVLEEGFVPTASVGAGPAWVEMADYVVIEVNMDSPPDLYGIHDIYRPVDGEPIPIRRVDDRVGSPLVRVPRDKIVAIVESRGIDHGGEPAEPSRVEKMIAENLLSFLQEEVSAGRLPPSLYPLESGVGTVNDAVFKALKDAGFKGLTAWTEVVQDSLLDLYNEGMTEAMSCTSLMLTPRNLERLYSNPRDYIEAITLRPQDITNNIEVIRRLRVIAINTAVEVDIYGNVNSTHVLGSKIINGIGGSGDYARGALLSIFITPSTRKGRAVSSIVPMASHVDTPDHDVDVIVTEQGVCDLRGLSPREKAELIIERCSHPDYRDKLYRYYRKALEYGGHIPVALEEAFSFHISFRDKKDMRL
ncbi:MAG: hypothetical protein F7C38_05465 [Desulfurococcales archaeon]|nr:hypothetical protein [Desulfurococcales archaeon]